MRTLKVRLVKKTETSDLFDGADFYDARESEQLTHATPEDAVEEFIDLWLNPESDVSAVIREHSPVKVMAYRIRPGWTDEEDNCDESGERTYDAAQVETMMRAHCPDWWQP
ncbi:MAG: hypothetical protein A2Z21_01900 [Candidatus Fraserbacteria bacterium RBG_16_55_9]|uniref:Uncharacterized protein n=1 Tax=Fraserbacteria sp. (strain RBG_16_55_9) TaxID=1817864 RepID=A0A1F5UP31_FRAXR|nr:MAG: hypothetical protein A2Z21_01900 [Candidatus Fraserbacteria bacterium RBG_16_55_9]